VLTSERKTILTCKLNRIRDARKDHKSMNARDHQVVPQGASRGASSRVMTASTAREKIDRKTKKLP